MSKPEVSFNRCAGKLVTHAQLTLTDLVSATATAEDRIMALCFVAQETGQRRSR